MRSLTNEVTGVEVLHHTVHHEAQTLSINIRELHGDDAPTGRDIDGITATEFGCPAEMDLADYVNGRRLTAFVQGLQGAPSSVSMATKPVEVEPAPAVSPAAK